MAERNRLAEVLDQHRADYLAAVVDLLGDWAEAVASQRGGVRPTHVQFVEDDEESTALITIELFDDNSDEADIENQVSISRFEPTDEDDFAAGQLFYAHLGAGQIELA